MAVSFVLQSKECLQRECVSEYNENIPVIYTTCGASRQLFRSPRGYIYMDDTFMIWQNDEQKLSEFFKALNPFHTNIKFALKRKHLINRLFLNILLKRTKDRKLSTRIFVKNRY